MNSRAVHWLSPATKIHYPFGPAPDGADVLWRCEAKRYSVVIDADADLYGVSDPQIELTWWHARRTPKGAWVCNRFVLLTARKKWAANSEAEAIESFIARRQKQIRILTKQLQRADAELALALNISR